MNNTADTSGPHPSFLTDGERLETLEREVTAIRTSIGIAPNAATGEPGSGMFKVVAGLASGNRRLIGGASAAAAGMVGLIELVSALLKGLGG